MRNVGTYLIEVVSIVMLASCTVVSDTSDTSSAAIGNNHDENENESEVPKDWFVAQRAFPHDAIDPVLRHKAFESAKTFARTGPEEAANWSLVGPDNIGGRITDIQASPARPSTIYLASAAGGVFRSDDRGVSFRPIFDGQASLAIGSIAVDPRNADVVWVGTGEANSSGDSYPGTGVYLTTDGGANWQWMGLERSQHIGRIVVDPSDSRVVYVAAMGSMRVEDGERGVFRTSDRGATWERVLFTSTRVGAVDVAVDPTDPSKVYAGMWERMRDATSFKKGGPGSGVFASTDGGRTWARSSKGLPVPSATSGRVGISLCASHPQTLYSIFDDTQHNFVGVYRSDDSGASWRRVDQSGIGSIFSSYGWWFGNVRVDPTNPERVFALGLYLARSDDGGATWTRAGRMHPDHHALYIDPTDPQRVYSGNDGGFHVSTNGGAAFTGPIKMPITQFYNIAVDPTVAGRVYGGAQDNGIVRTTTGATSDWRGILGGDGLEVVVDPVATNIVYAESQNGALAKSTDGGNNFDDIAPKVERSNWNTPIRLDPNNHNTVYFAGNKLLRSVDAGATWTEASLDLTNGPVPTRPGFATITTVSISPADSSTIYAGTDDANVWATRDGGATWSKVMTGLPHLYVTSLRADATDAATVWVTFSGFDEAPAGRVFESHDAGASWQPIGTGLPPLPVNVIVPSPSDRHTLYVGTDTGVFITHDSGANWRMLGSALPLVPVLDLIVDPMGHRLLAATHGRSIYALPVTL